MASDNHANYGRIGFTVFIGMFALAIALIKLGGVGDRNKELLVETYYDFPVSGLSVGSAVNFRGVKIGEVREISFVGAIYDDDVVETNDLQRVIIVMALDCSALDVNASEAEDIVRKFIAAGIRATIASNPVTGMSRIEFNIPPTPVPIADFKWKPRYLLIPSQPSLMENLSSSLAKALYQFSKTDFKSVWSNVASVAESSARITKDVSEIVHSEKAGVSGIVGNLKSTTASADELLERLKENPSIILRENDPQPLPETK